MGENGSGKTTLAKVLAGLYRPQSGAVCWDETAISDVDAEPLREQIAVIAQDHANWPLTVRHNIVMGRAADPRLLARSVAASGADTVIAGLPRGYDTLLDRQFKDGAELSGGQWQRIAVARGFYRSAPLLIMDEPTAALDARAEYALFSSVRVHAKDRSVLMITHRLASVRHADRIYVLRDGRVIEQGTHAELIALDGQYAELYNLQASQYVMGGALPPQPRRPGSACADGAAHEPGRDGRDLAALGPGPGPGSSRRRRAGTGPAGRSALFQYGLGSAARKPTASQTAAACPVRADRAGSAMVLSWHGLSCKARSTCATWAACLPRTAARRSPGGCCARITCRNSHLPTCRGWCAISA